MITFPGEEMWGPLPLTFVGQETLSASGVGDHISSSRNLCYTCTLCTSLRNVCGSVIIWKV